MKAPAMRVLKARIEAKVRTENQVLQAYQYKEDLKHQKALEQHRAKLATALKAAFAEDAGKYAKYEPGTYRSLQFTQAWADKQRDIEADNPEPMRKLLVAVYVTIASLNLTIRVADTDANKWEKFANACDEAFIEDDAKAILDALALVG